MAEEDMAEEDMKGDELLAEAAKVFNTPSPAGGSAATPQSSETTGTPPAPDAKPGEIKSDEDLFRQADQILGDDK